MLRKITSFFSHIKQFLTMLRKSISKKSHMSHVIKKCIRYIENSYILMLNLFYIIMKNFILFYIIMNN